MEEDAAGASDARAREAIRQAAAVRRAAAEMERRGVPRTEREARLRDLERKLLLPVIEDAEDSST